MKLLSHLSPTGGGASCRRPPTQRLLRARRAAWDEALAEAGDQRRAAAARAWSATPAGQGLLAAIFGNSPFLTGVAVAEWEFLVRARRGRRRRAVRGDRRRHRDTRRSRRRSGGVDAPAAHRQAPRRACLRRSPSWPGLEPRTADGGAEPLRRGGDRRGGAPSAAARGRARPLRRSDDPERDSGLIVLGMGKLGGGELNYSSDIDLILLYDPARAARCSRATTRRSLFNRLARELVRILDERTGDGYVFRTDLRLRPDPRSTPLAMSVAAALTYYESVGQNWERAALIKARPVAGDRDAGAALPRRAAAVYLAQAPRFRGDRRHPFDQAPDPGASRRRPHRGRRPRHQDRPRRHPRDRVLRPDAAADLGRAAARRCGSRRPARRCAGSPRAGRIDPADRRDADRGLPLSAPRRAPVADGRRRADPPAAGRSARGSRGSRSFLGYPDAEAFVAELRAHLALGREALRRAVRGGAEPRRPRQSRLHRRRRRPRHAGDPGAARLRRPGAVAAMVRDWHHGRMRATRSQRAREILTELVPELLRIFGATAHPDIGAVALRPVPDRACRPACSCFRCSTPIPGCSRSSPTSWPRRRYWRRAWRSARPCSTRC